MKNIFLQPKIEYLKKQGKILGVEKNVRLLKKCVNSITQIMWYISLPTVTMKIIPYNSQEKAQLCTIHNGTDSSTACLPAFKAGSKASPIT